VRTNISGPGVAWPTDGLASTAKESNSRFILDPFSTRRCPIRSGFAGKLEEDIHNLQVDRKEIVIAEMCREKDPATMV